MIPNDNDSLLTQRKVCELLDGQVAEATLEKWRMTGDGPPFIKVGRRVFYRRRDFEAWLTARTVSHTAQVKKLGWTADQLSARKPHQRPRKR